MALLSWRSWCDCDVQGGTRKSIVASSASGCVKERDAHTYIAVDTHRADTSRDIRVLRTTCMHVAMIGPSCVCAILESAQSIHIHKHTQGMCLLCGRKDREGMCTYMHVFIHVCVCMYA